MRSGARPGEATAGKGALRRRLLPKTDLPNAMILRPSSGAFVAGNG